MTADDTGECNVGETTRTTTTVFSFGSHNGYQQAGASSALTCGCCGIEVRVFGVFFKNSLKIYKDSGQQVEEPQWIDAEPDGTPDLNSTLRLSSDTMVN